MPGRLSFARARVSTDGRHSPGPKRSMQRDKPSAHDVLDGPLWACIRGTGSPTVVFEAGGGEDSSVWSELEAEVRDRYEVRTMLYDRAGLGRSPPSPPPYRIDREANALRREFDRHGITAPVVLVAHSYGGFVATIVAATDSRIAGSSSSTPTSLASSTMPRPSACSRRTGRSSLRSSGQRRSWQR